MASLVIFDFDDTILRLRIDWESVRSEIAAIAEAEGISADFSQHLIPLSNRLSLFPGMKGRIDGVYLRHETGCAQARSYEVFPGMVALVRRLRESGKRLAIASGNHSNSINAILAQIGLKDAFELVCGRDKVARNKPSPDQLELIVQELGADKLDAVFVGDSINDEGAAKAAGIRCIKIRPNNPEDISALEKALL